MIPVGSCTAVRCRGFQGGGEMICVGDGSGIGVGGGGSAGSFTSNLSSSPARSGSATRKVAKSHSEAERRRRQRINDHLSTLRTLLPHTSKMDKASLLTEVVRQVRELKKYVDDVAAKSPDTWKVMVPGESDEVRMDKMTATGETGLISVSICCEDRPGLLSEVNQVVRSVQARLVRAEMATVGGRTKSVVVMEGCNVEGEDRAMLHASLRSTLQKPGLTGNGYLEKRRTRVSRSLKN